jgi:hypothetical protein
MHSYISPNKNTNPKIENHLRNTKNLNHLKGKPSKQLFAGYNGNSTKIKGK